MTFAEFQATKREEKDLGALLKDECFGPNAGGLIYCQYLFIEDTTNWPDDAPGKGMGRWYTLIGRDEFQSDDLEPIERALYQFAVPEGYTTEDRS